MLREPSKTCCGPPETRCGDPRKLMIVIIGFEKWNCEKYSIQAKNYISRILWIALRGLLSDRREEGERVSSCITKAKVRAICLRIQRSNFIGFGPQIRNSPLMNLWPLKSETVSFNAPRDPGAPKTHHFGLTMWFEGENSFSLSLSTLISLRVFPRNKDRKAFGVSVGQTKGS